MSYSFGTRNAKPGSRQYGEARIETPQQMTDRRISVTNRSFPNKVYPPRYIYTKHPFENLSPPSAMVLKPFCGMRDFEHIFSYSRKPAILRDIAVFGLFARLPGRSEKF